LLFKAGRPRKGIDGVLSHYEDAFFALRRQPLANVVVEAGGAGFVNAELHDGNVCFG
jgi:hypothetical protein